MKRILFAFLCVPVCCAVADDADLVNQIQYKEQLVNELKEEIAQIDSEMVRCEKTKKGWVAATVVGGVGVAATGTAAIIQGVKLNQKKNEKPENQTGKQ